MIIEDYTCLTFNTHMMMMKKKKKGRIIMMTMNAYIR